jgi:hypothetical protein
MKVFRRSLFAWLALLGILFSQLALATYVCPLLNPSLAMQQMDEMGGMADMSDVPCAQMDMAVNVDEPAVCASHCDQGSQVVSSTAVLDFQPALVFLLTVPAVRSSEAAPRQTHVQPSLLTRITSPPPLWRSARLRI